MYVFPIRTQFFFPRFSSFAVTMSYFCTMQHSHPEIGMLFFFFFWFFWIIMSKNLFLINLLLRQTRKKRTHRNPNAVAVIMKELNHHQLCAIVRKRILPLPLPLPPNSIRSRQRRKKKNFNQFKFENFVCVKIEKLHHAQRDTQSTNRWRLIYAMDSVGLN